MEKIDLVEILKDCPTGMELDCTVFRGLEFDHIDENNGVYPIICRVKTEFGSYNVHTFNKYGCYSMEVYSKCVIFPKGKTTWEGFVPPCKFKDGDIIFTHTNASKGLLEDSWVSIFKEYRNNRCACYACLCLSDLELYHDKWEDELLCELCEIEENRLATEEEKQKLFKAIKDNGYQWNPETKTLEELFPYKIGTKVWAKSDKEHKYIHTIVGISSNSFGNLEYEIKEEKTGTVAHYPKDLLIPVTEEKPKFKVGDKIRHKENKTWGCTIKRVTDRYYVDGHPTCFTLLFEQQNEYELVPNKFDINTLIPFESRVLVRDNDYDEWKGAFWSHLRQKADIKYDTIRGVYRQCIPYNDDTKHLLGKTNSCNDYYKIWK